MHIVATVEPKRRRSKIERPERVNVFAATGGACRENQATCDRVLCRYHLAGPIEEGEGPESILSRETIERCALEAADHGPMTLEQVAIRFGFTRERMRQVEVKSLAKIAKRCPELFDLFEAAVLNRPTGPIYPAAVKKLGHPKKLRDDRKDVTKW